MIRQLRGLLVCALLVAPVVTAGAPLRPLPRPSGPPADLSSLCGAGSFGTIRGYHHHQTGPFRVALGDFDEDGIPDVASVRSSGDGITWIWRGTGTGDFELEGFVEGIRGYSRDARAADFDRDGHLDLAVLVDQNPGAVQIFAGDGTGQFARPPAVFRVDSPQKMDMGDLNGDGLPDLVIASYPAGTAVLFGDGAGGLTPAVYYASGEYPHDVATRDVDADGDLDLLAAAPYAGRVVLRLNDGAGSFGAPAAFRAGTHPDRFTVGDFNRDGLLDVAAASATSVAVLLSVEPGVLRFARTVDAPYGVAEIASGDLNGDGRLDLATISDSTSDVAVRPGDGSGGFGAPAVFNAHSVGATNLQIVDVTNDYRPDLVVSTWFTFDSLVVLPNTCPYSCNPAPGGGCLPIARCMDVTVSTAGGCAADASIDDGSFDPDGGNVRITQSPAGPYPVGTTPVTLTIVDDEGNSVSCGASVTVVREVGVSVRGSNGDTFEIVTDVASPAYRLWRYRVASTGTTLTGVANGLTYVPGRSLLAYDTDYSAENPQLSMSANVNLAAVGGTVTVQNRTTGVRNTLRVAAVASCP
jgi:hypothetical protein